LHFALGVSSSDEDYWLLAHEVARKKMMKASHRTFQRVVPVLDSWTKASSNSPTVLDVFELRSSLATSLVFWRGHMWTYRSADKTLRHLNRVPAGYHPSGGLAPLFFRCLARENAGSSGLARLITGWTSGKTPAAAGGSTSAQSRISICTVQWHNRWVITTASSGQASTCLLASFTVTSRYFKHIDDAEASPCSKKPMSTVPQTELPPSRRQGWPDRQFTREGEDLPPCPAIWPIWPETERAMKMRFRQLLELATSGLLYNCLIKEQY
uniref:Mediator of RNA polymerase II transcription subunit 13 n=1 Tax=Macrostomum lignano TaxID=282301 RepID=A0A1I8JRH7_9PLAT